LKIYILRRLIQCCIVVIMVTVFVFLLVRLLPGDPVLLYISMDTYTEATTKDQLAELRHEFGLDRPIYEQYAVWVYNAVRGDLGESKFLNNTVLKEIGTALPKTAFLGLLAWILSIIAGIPLGIIAAVKRGQWIDSVVTVLANIGITAPVFWVGIMLIQVFGVTLDWLPIQGYTSILSNPGMGILKAIMPVFCLALWPISSTARQTRSAMLEVIRQDFIRTAWSKGLTEFSIIMRHALKNSIIPIITLVGLQINGIIGGSVLIESVFNIPGMGRLAVEGLQNNDYVIVQGVILIVATFTTLVNLIVDLSYGLIDPRIRHQ